MTTRFTMRLPRRGIQATAVQRGNVFVVRKGSTASGTIGALNGDYAVLRDRLIESGELCALPSGLLEFSRATKFTSPSAAASIVAGRQTNGLTNWKRGAALPASRNRRRSFTASKRKVLITRIRALVRTLDRMDDPDAAFTREVMESAIARLSAGHGAAKRSGSKVRL